MNGLTARLALDMLNLTAGQTIAVTGSAGAVGGYAIQLAKVDGLRVVADAATADHDLVAHLGADQIVARGPGVGQRIRASWPDGVAAVVDAALQGSEVVPALRDGGQIAALRGLDGRVSMALRSVRDVVVREVWIPEYTHSRRKLNQLRSLTEQGMLTLRVARTYPAARAAEAHRALEAGGVRGRLVLTFD
jgi:NADPH:quinone reductase-like Zn-dependent oxidoreductase